MFFIRSGNKVVSGIALSVCLELDEITPTTKFVPVLAFTTRKDAEEFLATIVSDLKFEVSNNLDYQL